jgi:hypothetical protein
VLGISSHFGLPRRQLGHKDSEQGRATKAQRYSLKTGMGTPKALARRRGHRAAPPLGFGSYGATPEQPGEREGRSPEGVHPRAPVALVASARGTSVPTLTTEQTWTNRTAAVAVDARTETMAYMVLDNGAAAEGRQDDAGGLRRRAYYFLETLYAVMTGDVIGLMQMRDEEGFTGICFLNVARYPVDWPHGACLFPILAAGDVGLGAERRARAAMATAGGLTQQCRRVST